LQASNTETSVAANASVSKHLDCSRLREDNVGEDEVEQFVYYTHGEPHITSSHTSNCLLAGPEPDITIPALKPTPDTKPVTSQLEFEKNYAAAASGDLDLLQRLFKRAMDNENIDTFTLANQASARSGLTLLHVAASKGHSRIVQWRKRPFYTCHDSSRGTSYHRLRCWRRLGG
jgi:hypothetical protein